VRTTLRVLGTVGLAACAEAAAPSPPPLTLGTFQLQRVDGNLLPQPLMFSTTSCVVTSATLELFADTTFIWWNSCDASQTDATVAAIITGAFRQAAQDSVEFPVFPGRFAPGPVAMARKRGDSLIVVTSGGTFGVHRWSFHESP
jgi:hypothetical protein